MPPPNEELDRRRFHELSAAALSGLLAGAASGCRYSPQNPPTKAPPGVTAIPASEKHACRGLNDCKGQSAGGKNECRGQGDCATFAAHTCGAQNDCKGQGGCGENPALNECKGQGSCAIPLMPAAWKAVRERSEAIWKEKGKNFGDAPATK